VESPGGAQPSEEDLLFREPTHMVLVKARVAGTSPRRRNSFQNRRTARDKGLTGLLTWGRLVHRDF
jgi:hypothetical protein